MTADPRQEMRDVLERNFAHRMRIMRVRLVLWLVVILVAYWFYPDVWWIKWMLGIPLLSLLVMGVSYLRLKRDLESR